MATVGRFPGLSWYRVLSLLKVRPPGDAEAPGDRGLCHGRACRGVIRVGAKGGDVSFLLVGGYGRALLRREYRGWGCARGVAPFGGGLDVGVAQAALQAPGARVAAGSHRLFAPEGGESDHRARPEAHCRAEAGTVQRSPSVRWSCLMETMRRIPRRRPRSTILCTVAAAAGLNYGKSSRSSITATSSGSRPSPVWWARPRVGHMPAAAMSCSRRSGSSSVSAVVSLRTPGLRARSSQSSSSSRARR